MKAAVLRQRNTIALEEREVPRTGPGDVLIKVRAASICGTDLKIIANGHFKIAEGQARVLGHEVTGEIVEVGRDRRLAAGMSVGSRVSLTPNVGCGHCRWCRRGLNNMCPDYDAFGITLDGGFAEYLLVPGFAVDRGNLFAVPQTLSDPAAALVEPLSCCVRGQDSVEVGVDDVVLIIGTGPIGLLHIKLAKLAGAGTVIAANRSAGRLAGAQTAGADVLVETGRTDLAAAVADVTGGEGVDVAICAAAGVEVQQQAVDLLGTHGRASFFSGLPSGPAGTPKVPLDTNRLHYRGIRLTGTTGSSNADYERALRLAGDGRVGLDDLVGQSFPLDGIDDALAYARSGSGLKSMIIFETGIGSTFREERPHD